MRSSKLNCLRYVSVTVLLAGASLFAQTSTANAEDEHTRNKRLIALLKSNPLDKPKPVMGTQFVQQAMQSQSGQGRCTCTCHSCHCCGHCK